MTRVHNKLVFPWLSAVSLWPHEYRDSGLQIRQPMNPPGRKNIARSSTQPLPALNRLLRLNETIEQASSSPWLFKTITSHHIQHHGKLHVCNASHRGGHGTTTRCSSTKNECNTFSDKRLPALNCYVTKLESKLHKIVSCGILCHYVTMVTFRMTLLMNKWTYIFLNEGWVHALQKSTFSCQQLVMRYSNGWLEFGWKITR